VQAGAPAGTEPEYAGFIRRGAGRGLIAIPFPVGEDLVNAALGSRDDKAGALPGLRRTISFSTRRWRLFCYVDRAMGPPQMSDLGLFSCRAWMLLLREEGPWNPAPQEVLVAVTTATLADFLEPPEELMLFTVNVGLVMPIPAAPPANQVGRSPAAQPLDEFARFSRDLNLKREKKADRRLLEKFDPQLDRTLGLKMPTWLEPAEVSTVRIVIRLMFLIHLFCYPRLLFLTALAICAFMSLIAPHLMADLFKRAPPRPAESARRFFCAIRAGFSITLAALPAPVAQVADHVPNFPGGVPGCG